VKEEEYIYPGDFRTANV